MSMRRIGSLGLARGGAALLLGLSACVDVDADDAVVEDMARHSGELVGGHATSLRPEIGHIIETLPGTPPSAKHCTGTLIDKQHIVTASHCFAFKSGKPVNPTSFVLDLPTTPPSQASYAITHAFALGSVDDSPNGVGPLDIAIARLATAVPSTQATPTTFVKKPAAGAKVSVFGYGLNDREQDPATWTPTKQYLDYAMGPSEVSAGGDSGGPRLVGFAAATPPGGIWGITSGYNIASGLDTHADAATWGPKLWKSIQLFGHSAATNVAVDNFPAWSRVTTGKVKALAGDFDGDGKGDMALVGGQGWTTIPVAFSRKSPTGQFGHFQVTSATIADFPGYASSSTIAVAGDFDRDGDDDIALLGGPANWTKVPVALSNRDGTFTVKFWTSPELLVESQGTGMYAVAGDWNGDGDDDIALVGDTFDNNLWVGLSNGTNGFLATSALNADVMKWARVTPKRAVVGDFDADGKDDLAFAGGVDWTDVRVALSDGSGGFVGKSIPLGYFNTWLRADGAKLVAGDFDGDGRADVASVGGAGRTGVTFGLSRKDASGNLIFSLNPLPMGGVPASATAARFIVSGRIDDNAGDDLLLTGGAGWTTLPTVLFKK